MAVVKVAFTRFGAIFTALAADTKPTSGIGLLAGCMLIETDTGTLFVFDGVSTWNSLATDLPDVEVPISAAAMRGTVTFPAGDANGLPERAETSSNLVNYDYLAFDTTQEENAYFQYSIPQGWDEGTLTFRYKWTNTAGLAAETVVFGLKAVAISTDGVLDVAWGSEVTITSTFTAQGDVVVSAESAAVTVGGTPAEGDIIMFNMARKTGSDDLTGDARLLEVIITFTRESGTD